MDLANYDALLNRIYESALRPDSWWATLGAIADAVSSDKAVLYTFQTPPERGGFAITHNLPPEGPEAWSRISRNEDPHLLALNRMQVFDGFTFEGTELVPVPTLHASRLYRDIWAFHGMEHMMVGLIFIGTDGRKLPTCISLFRPPTAPNFTQDEVAVLRRLVVHLSRALGVMFHLRDADHRLAASHAALDRLQAGVLLLGEDRRIVHANEAAERLLREGRAIGATTDPRTGARQLALAPGALPEAAASFETAVTGALQRRDEEAQHFSNGLVLHDPDGRPSCVVHVAPFADADALLAPSAVRAIVFLYPLQGVQEAPSSLLPRIFGLTPAETRAAHALLEGGSQNEVAQRLGISPNTLKSQLASLYAKTNTHRHADLLKLLLTLG